jgi:hypothetical protein
MATPDLIGAIIAYARSVSALAAPTGSRISGTRQKAWPLPTKALVVTGPLGGPVGEPPLRRSRVQLECYGTTELTSKELAEIVVAVFAPDSGPSARFTLAGVDVGRVEKEAEPIWLPDPETQWPRTVAPLIFTWTGVAS